MVTTFVRSAGNHTRGMWKFLSTVCQTDRGMKLAELEHSSLKKMYSFLFWEGPYFGSPLSLWVPKVAVSPGCRKNHQEQPSYH